MGEGRWVEGGGERGEGRLMVWWGGEGRGRYGG